MITPTVAAWEDFIDQVVVLDVESPYVYLGTLKAERGGYLVLHDADAHDLRDTNTTREKYVLDSREHGIRPNRKKTYVDLRQVVAITLLSDVIAY